MLGSLSNAELHVVTHTRIFLDFCAADSIIPQLVLLSAFNML